MKYKNSKECPYFSELVDSWKLRRELDRERKRREEAELNGKVLNLISLALIAFIAGAAIFLTIYSGISAEVIEAYTNLFVAVAALFFALAFTLLTVDLILRAIIRRFNERKEKKAEKKKEDGNA